MQDVIVEFHPPTDPLTITKALLDVATVAAFILVLVMVIYAKNRYPMMERKKTFWPLLVSAIFGTISMAMDAIDEWVWFTPKAFYDVIWKPTRLLLFLVSIFILIIAFRQFYDFSHRLFGEDVDG